MEPASVMRAAAALVVLAGLAGAASVALAAAGAHKAALSDLSTAGQILMMHAVAVLAIVAVAMRAAHPEGFLAAALIILVGVSLFAGAITVRTFWASSLFPMAGPLGGSTMILGWLALAAAGVWEAFAHRG